MARISNKVRNAAQSAKGKAKEATGEASHSGKLRRKGKADQVKSKAKRAGEKVKSKLR